MYSSKVCLQGKEIPQESKEFLWPARRQLTARMTGGCKEYGKGKVLKGGR